MNNMYIHITGQRPDGRCQDMLIEADAYIEAIEEAREEDDEAGPEIYFLPGSTNVKVVGNVELRYEGEIALGMYPEWFGEGL